MGLKNDFVDTPQLTTNFFMSTSDYIDIVTYDLQFFFEYHLYILQFFAFLHFFIFAPIYFTFFYMIFDFLITFIEFWMQNVLGWCGSKKKTDRSMRKKKEVLRKFFLQMPPPFKIRF